LEGKLSKRLVITFLTVFLLAFCLFLPQALAHTPLGTQDNESIETATVIPDPTKSWALYSQLNVDGDPQYYTFNISTGQTIHVLLYKSLRPEDANFNPVLVLMGQNVNSSDGIPSKITVPQDYNAQLIHPTSPQPAFEPFSPGVLAYVTDLTIDNATGGQYYLVVYEASSNPTGGHYGLAIGETETYTIDEWVLIPLNLIGIYQWEGQNLALILAPMIITVIVGLILVALRQRKHRDLANPMAWLASIAGLTFIGTAASTLYQLVFCATQVPTGLEAIITLIFAVIPLMIGVLTLRLALKNSQTVTIRKRIYFVVLGVAALFIWAGFFIGPILAIVVAVMPTKLRKHKNKEASMTN
jgi:hypothetical protein